MDEHFAHASATPAAPTSMAMRPHAAPAVPLADPKDLEARAKRLDAERLLTSKRLESGEDASKGVDLLLELDPAQRAKAIDQLGAKALDNMLERVPADQYEKLEGLVEASRDPRRKLRMWERVHKTRAQNDLDRYGSDFGSNDEQTDEQRERERRKDRRAGGVESDAHEVDADVAALLAKPDLSVDDVDQLRARKDRELAIEMKYNINLSAQRAPRDNGTPVQWTVEELGHVDAALSQIPAAQLNDPKMTAQLGRLNWRFGDPRGEYHFGGGTLDITDAASSDQGAPAPYGPRSLVSDEFRKHHGDHSAPLEEVLVHEIGHNVEEMDKAAFEKFSKVGHWRDNLTEADLRRDGASSDVVDSLELGRRNTTGGNKIERTPTTIFSTNNRPEKGRYGAMDATAVPNTPGMAYGGMNAHELFAEVYAQAVLTPETLYADFVSAPTQAAKAARDEVAGQREHLAALQRSGASADQLAEAQRLLTRDEEQARTTAQAQRQQGEEFSIMRNDVFHTDRAQREAEARLVAAHATPQQLARFKERALHASTPNQIEELERETTR